MRHVALAIALAACGGATETPPHGTGGSRARDGGAPEQDAGQTEDARAADVVETTVASEDSRAPDEVETTVDSEDARAADVVEATVDAGEPCFDADARRCVGQEAQYCNRGFWAAAGGCTFICVGDGVCSGICAPGSIRCVGNRPQSCDATGSWIDSGTGCLCIEGAVVTCACTPGSIQCTGNQPQSCSPAGSWVDVGPPCSVACFNGICGDCQPGVRRCNGNQPQICNPATEWVDSGSACFFGCDNGSCTVDCPDGFRQCSGTHEQVCMGGVWFDTDVGCADAGTADSAAPGDGPATLADAAICSPGARRCDGPFVPQVCSAFGNWVSAQACQCLCISGTCGDCPPGMLFCNGLQPQIVLPNLERESFGSPCAVACSGGSCVGSCVPGDTRCNGARAQVCSESSAWTDTGDACFARD